MLNRERESAGKKKTNQKAVLHRAKTSKEPAELKGQQRVDMQKTPMHQMGSGLDPLKVVLSDTFVLYMKTYAVHWNYRGDKFFSVHKLTEHQYEELAEAIDEIAERIRAIGGEAPISLSSILDGADLKEFQEHSANKDRALRELADGHATLAKRAQEAIESIDESNDLYSCDLLIGRIGAHEKAAWMLRSFLAGGT